MLNRRRGEDLYEMLEEETFLGEDRAGGTSDEALFEQSEAPRRAGLRLMAIAALLVVLAAVFVAVRPDHDGDNSVRPAAAGVPRPPSARAQRRAQVSASRRAPLGRSRRRPRRRHVVR